MSTPPPPPLDALAVVEAARSALELPTDREWTPVEVHRALSGLGTLLELRERLERELAQKGIA